MTENKFSWVETHKELTQFLSTKENSQKELINLLKSVGINPFNDKAKLGEHDTELDEIDPFTFFCYIYKYGPKRRLKYLQKIAETLNISIPNDDSGIPSANAQLVWLFPYKYERVNNEIDRLWDFFNKAINNNVTNNDFADVLTIRNVAKAKITEALFNINPEKYFPINGPTKEYLKNELGIAPSFETYSDYIALLESIKSKISIPFYELSYKAWKWKDKREIVNYWVFQGNPKIFNIVGSLNDNKLTTWSVKAHEDKIKVGDKIILWVTGNEQGCYALGEVTSEVYEGPDEEDQIKYYTEQSKNEISKRVKIKVTNNLSNNPLRIEEIENIPELKDLKVGNQGTNFSASEEEYTTLLGLIDSRASSFEKLKSQLNKSDFNFYIEFLIEIINEFNLKKGDNRLVFSIRENRLNFTIGQRYCWNIYLADERGKFRVISKDKIDFNSEPYEGANPQAYYTHFNDNIVVKNNMNSIFRSIKDELDRTTKSGYRRHNHTVFENYVFEKLLSTKKDNSMNLPLNTILYGPPGTGKTYNSIDRAVAIATGSSSDHISNKKIFDELRKQGQIEFVTFHQNYSYEDFMVGIRPNIDEGTNNLSFRKHYGVFYKIAERARENYENSFKDEQTISKENWVKEKFEEFQDYVQAEIDKNGKFAIKNNVSIYSVEDEVFIYTGEKENGELWKNQRIGMHYDALIKIYLADVQNRQDIKKLENVPSLEKQHSTYSFELIEKFREFLSEKGYKFQSTTVQKEPLKNLVLIIDEINRANISKVFGELITLLEDDKRLGKPNELKITLPNGEKEFGVPPNLYLIGTMNTADKSIALIDIALRRRFEFIGYYPDYENLKTEAKTLLQKINEEIYKLKNSADYLIGHAYFMRSEAIETTLRNKVIPLLMEYFSGKTKIVSDIFKETTWKVEYDTTKFDWSISPR